MEHESFRINSVICTFYKKPVNLIENTPRESEKSLKGNRQTPLEHSLRHFVGWFIVQEITVVTITKWERKKKKKILLLAYWEETVISRIAFKSNCWAGQKGCLVYGKT